jgi:hypothetical protein
MLAKKVSSTHNMHKNQFLSLIGMALIGMALSLINPGLGFSDNTPENQTVYTTTHARLSVERAWDTYHHAALGGTLASPRIQSKLEMNLHKSRSLLAEAYDAEEKGDIQRTQDLIKEILEITQKVIAESQEPKK